MDLEWCRNPEKGLLRPDIVFFLDLDPNVAASRKDYGQERYERLDFQIKVRNVFQTLLQDESNVRFVSADRQIEAVHAELAKDSAEAIFSLADAPLQFNLWN